MRAIESERGPERLQDVFEVLSGDLNMCFEPLQQSLENPDEDGNYSFEGSAARTYVNVAFACIASVSTSMRQWAVDRLGLAEGDYSFEQHAQQLGAGKEMTPLEKAVRLGFGLLDHACNVEFQWPAGEQWWLSLHRAIEIKYRLASPQSAADLQISAEELMTVVDAEAGFRLRLAAYLEEQAPTPQYQLSGE